MPTSTSQLTHVSQMVRTKTVIRPRIEGRRSLQGPEARREFVRQFVALGGAPGLLEGWTASRINHEGMGCFYPPRPEAVGYFSRRFRNVTAVAKYLLTDYDPFAEKGTSKAVAPARLAWKWKAIKII